MTVVAAFIRKKRSQLLMEKKVFKSVKCAEFVLFFNVVWSKMLVLL